MTTLFLAWQDERSRRWFPVGRLTQNEVERKKYEFAYVRGAEQAKESARFVEIPGFPKLDVQYRASELFPAFRYRLMNPSRPDRPEYLRQLGIGVNDWDAVTELSLSGGRIQSDRFETFPAIRPDADGRFQAQFVLHGLRHTNPNGVEASEKLEVGDELRLAFELNNPVATHGILVYTHDYHMLGWLPRYLVDGMHKDNAWMVVDVSVKVAQVNHGAPLSHRLLLDFIGRLPEGFNPMRDLEQYQPIAAASVAAGAAPPRV